MISNESLNSRVSCVLAVQLKIQGPRPGSSGGSKDDALLVSRRILSGTSYKTNLVASSICFNTVATSVNKIHSDANKYSVILFSFTIKQYDFSRPKDDHPHNF